MTAPQSTNYAKFQTGNPIVRRLIDRFYSRVLASVEPMAPSSLLDAGCGEGETLARFGRSLPPRTVAVDTSAEAVAFTAERFPAAEVARERVEALPFSDAEFDLVLCLEVIEHLDQPETAVAELARVSSGHVIVSVPFEPWFRLGSLARGKYVATLGNHPEHVNHFNRASLRQLLDGDMDEVRVEVSFPWLIAHCRPRAPLASTGARLASKSA